MTARYFFITGHQRSRTAWLANLFTDSRAFCWHDASRMMRSPPNLHEIVNEKVVKADAIGDSDNGLPLFPTALDWYLERQPDLPVAVIWRNVDDVFRSLKRMHGGRVSDKALCRSIEVCQRGLGRIVSEVPNVQEYDFHDLNDVDVLMEMSRFLLGREVEKQRAASLRMFNVQLQEPHYSANYSAAFQAYVRNLIGV